MAVALKTREAWGQRQIRVPDKEMRQRFDARIKGLQTGESGLLSIPPMAGGELSLKSKNNEK